MIDIRDAPVESLFLLLVVIALSAAFVLAFVACGDTKPATMVEKTITAPGSPAFDSECNDYINHAAKNGWTFSHMTEFSKYAVLHFVRSED